MCSVALHSQLFDAPLRRAPIAAVRAAPGRVNTKFWYILAKRTAARRVDGWTLTSDHTVSWPPALKDDA